MKVGVARTGIRGVAAKIAAGTLAVAMAAACSSVDITAQGATELATTSTTAPSTTAPSTTAPPTTATKPSTTTTTSTTTSTTTTTTLPDPCAVFNSLTLSGQMSAVRAQQAPPNPECETAVANATKAVATADTASGLNERFNQEESAIDGYVDCDASGSWIIRWTNTTQYPISLFGYYYQYDDNDQILGIRVLWYPNLAAGATVNDPNLIEATYSCGYSVAMLVGDDTFAPLDPPTAVSVDDPQAVDDPAVWFPALQEKLNTGREAGSVEYLIDNVYDVHASSIFAEASPEPDEIVGPSELTYCSTLDAVPPAGLEGRFAVLLLTGYNGVNTNDDPLYLGYFARGNDRRWRILTITNTVTYPFDANNPCAAPPLM